MKITTLLLVTATATLTGCAIGPTPQNAQEYREAALRKDYGYMYETFEVNNSYKKVSAILKAKGEECFNSTVTAKECRGTNCMIRRYDFFSHFSNKGKSSELIVQTKLGHDAVFVGGKPPQSGLYVGIADAVDLGNGRTKVTVYGAKITLLAHIPRAMKNWASGTNLGCPDFGAEL